MNLAGGRLRYREHGSEQRAVTRRQWTSTLDHRDARAFPRRPRPFGGPVVALQATRFDLSPLDDGLFSAVRELIGHAQINGDVALVGDDGLLFVFEVVLLRNVGDLKVGSLPWVVGDFGDVKAEAEVAHGDVPDVFRSLVEGGADFRGVAVRPVNTVVPVAEITGGRVQRRRLKIGVLRHVGHFLPVVFELAVVGALAVRAVAPWPKNEFGVRVMGQGGFEFTGTVSNVVVHHGHFMEELGLWLAVSTPPVLIGHAVSVVVFSVNVIFVDLSVTVVVAIVHRSVVDVVVGAVQFTLSRRTCAGD